MPFEPPSPRLDRSGPSRLPRGSVPDSAEAGARSGQRTAGRGEPTPPPRESPDALPRRQAAPAGGGLTTRSRIRAPLGSTRPTPLHDLLPAPPPPRPNASPTPPP